VLQSLRSVVVDGNEAVPLSGGSVADALTQTDTSGVNAASLIAFPPALEVTHRATWCVVV
jgi:hypothetical protein